MRRSAVSGETIYTDWMESGDSLATVAQRLGVNANTARRLKRDYERTALGAETAARSRAGSDLHFEERDGGAEAWSKSARIQTLEQLLVACEVDTAVWEVDRYQVNKWESAVKGDGGVEVTPLFQVKAWLKRRAAAPIEQALEQIVERLKVAAPHVKASHSKLAITGEFLLIPSLYDAHFNKRSADGQYTAARAAQEFMAVADALAARVQTLGMAVERVLFPVGNDALHADNLAGDTTDGTRLELAGDQRDAVDALLTAYTHAVERFADLAPVDAVVVEGNHDRFASYWLGKALEARFWNDARVAVDTSNTPRKYYRYGATLLAMEHGDKVKPDQLAVLMATEAPELWAQTTYRQWMRGHVHHAAGMYYPVTEAHGVSVRVIPALCPPDQYHVLHGFVGNAQAATAQYIDVKHGPAGEFPVFVDEVALPHAPTASACASSPARA